MGEEKRNFARGSYVTHFHSLALWERIRVRDFKFIKSTLA